jgi:hypothetical protein
MSSILKVDTIQDQAGNNIINESSDTITIGASGDTITIPSGATLSSTDPLVFPAGTASLPAITTTGDTNTGIFFPAADTIGFAEGGAEAMRINSSGQVPIGTTSASLFNNAGGSARLVVSASNSTTTVGSNVDSAIAICNSDTTANNLAGLHFCFGSTVNLAGASIVAILGTKVTGQYPTGQLVFLTSGTTNSAPIEKMRITNDGQVLIGLTSFGYGTKGITLNAPGNVATFTNNEELALFNRLSTDGNLIRFFQATVEEGSISVSGATVSYNGFTGTHWSRFIDESKPDVLRGTVMESLDQMTDWYHAEFETSYTEQDKDGNDVVKTTIEKKPYALKANEQEGDIITYAWNTEKKDEEGNDIIEQVQATIVKQVDVKHVMSKISDTVEAKNVYGVFSAWDNDDLINNDFYVASVGSFVVRIKAGQVVAKGDLLQSNGDGTAKVQADDIIRASTFAKVLSNTVIETYEDGSFIVPCSLMC